MPMTSLPFMAFTQKIHMLEMGNDMKYICLVKNILGKIKEIEMTV